MTELDIPQERDLPAGRLTQLKDDLMAQIEQDIERETRAAPAGGRRRWRRIGLTAAAVAAGFGLVTSVVLDGSESASANTAVRSDDGAILITLREGKDPEALERRLDDLGVPAAVDFLDMGFTCDPDRSTGWVMDPPEDVLDWEPWDPQSTDDEYDLVLRPELLQPGQTVVMEFQIDEHEGRIVKAAVTTKVSAGPVDPCVPIPDDSPEALIDPDADGIAG